jgi:hypothetical protein
MKCEKCGCEYSDTVLPIHLNNCQGKQKETTSEEAKEAAPESIKTIFKKKNKKGKAK